MSYRNSAVATGGHGRGRVLVAATTIAAAFLLPNATPVSAQSAPPHAAAGMAYGQARTFARVPDPGQPEGIAVDPDDGSVWTGSNRARAAAALWHYAADGTLLRRYDLRGHAAGADHGVNGIALDGDGMVHALDYSGARDVRLDPATGQQEVYATFPNLPACSSGRTPCEPSPVDRPAWPNWPTFDAAGNLYVSDLHQATIWKVPKGGGIARVWYQNTDFASLYSLNGMQFDASGRLNFVLTVSMKPDLSTLARGVLFRLTVNPDGTAGSLSRTGLIGIGDGLAIGRSGRIYAPLSQPFANTVQVVDPTTGGTVDNLPHAEVQAALPIPFDAPASAAFRGTSLLVTNHVLYSANARHWAVLELGVGEPGLPLNYPRLGPLSSADPYRVPPE
jgi:hypothetical protein